MRTLTRLLLPPLRNLRQFSGSPKPYPSKPHPCNMPQPKTEVALKFLKKLRRRRCTANIRFSAMQTSFLPKAALQKTEDCIATLKKLRFRLPRFTFRLPHLGPMFRSRRNSESGKLILRPYWCWHVLGTTAEPFKTRTGNHVLENARAFPEMSLPKLTRTLAAFLTFSSVVCTCSFWAGLNRGVETFEWQLVQASNCHM